MYYVVLIWSSGSTPTYRSLINVYFWGLCVETSDPRQFCQSPSVATVTEAALMVPLGILIILFVPPILYVIVLSVWNVKKGMRVNAVLFILPIFTNLYFNLKSDIQADVPRKSVSLEWQPRARSHSAPNISIEANKAPFRKRFCTLICLHISSNANLACMKTLSQVCFNRQLGISREWSRNATARALTFSQQHPLCILLCR